MSQRPQDLFLTADLQKALQEHQEKLRGAAHVVSPLYGSQADALRTISSALTLHELSHLKSIESATRYLSGLDTFSTMKRFETGRLLAELRSVNAIISDKFTTPFDKLRGVFALGPNSAFFRDHIAIERLFKQMFHVNPLGEAFQSALNSVESIVFSDEAGQLAQMLGNRFESAEFFELNNSRDAKNYLTRTELPVDFIDAPAPCISASHCELGLVRPFRAITPSQSPRQQKKIQQSNERLSLWDALSRLELLVRERVNNVMTAAHGDDWALQSNDPIVKGWVKKFGNQSSSSWRRDFSAREEVEKSQFSELLKYAFLSAECSPHFVADSSVCEADRQRLINDLVIARNARQHYFESSSPETRTIVFGFVVQLAMIAGLPIRGHNEVIDVHAS
jgi:hypothetical protein